MGECAGCDAAVFVIRSMKRVEASRLAKLKKELQKYIIDLEGDKLRIEDVEALIDSVFK